MAGIPRIDDDDIESDIGDLGEDQNGNAGPAGGDFGASLFGAARAGDHFDWHEYQGPVAPGYAPSAPMPYGGPTAPAALQSMNDREYFAYDGGSNTALLSHNPYLPLPHDPDALPEPQDQSANDWMQQFMNWSDRSSPPGGGNQLTLFGSASLAARRRDSHPERSPAAPEYFERLRQYAVQYFGSPGASGPSHHGAGQPVAQTSHPDPVVAAPIGYTLPAPMFPAVDSQEVAWAQSNEVHPIFLPENLPLRPRYSYDLPQDALDNLRRAVAGSEGRAPQVAYLYGYSGGRVIDSMRREGMAQYSMTGLTMIPLDPRPTNFGQSKLLTFDERELIKRQFNRGWSVVAIAHAFGVDPKTVRFHKTSAAPSVPLPYGGPSAPAPPSMYAGSNLPAPGSAASEPPMSFPTYNPGSSRYPNWSWDNRGSSPQHPSEQYPPEQYPSAQYPFASSGAGGSHEFWQPNQDEPSSSGSEGWAPHGANIPDQEEQYSSSYPRLSEPQSDPQDWNAGYGPGQEYFAYDGGSNTASSSHNPYLPLPHGPDASPDPYDQSENDRMQQFMDWPGQEASRVISRNPHGAQVLAELTRGRDGVFGAAHPTPPPGHSSSSGDSGEAPHGSANAPRIQRLGPPEASGSSRLGDGAHVARTSHSDPLVEALLSNHPEDAMFPAVDSQDVPWAQSSEVHPLFQPENLLWMPRIIHELPQDALDNLRRAVAAFRNKEEAQKVADRFEYHIGTIARWKREGLPKSSTTGPTMRRLDARPENFGQNTLTQQEIDLLRRQFGRGHGGAAIARHFGIAPKTVWYYRNDDGVFGASHPTSPPGDSSSSGGGNQLTAFGSSPPADTVDDYNPEPSPATAQYIEILRQGAGGKTFGGPVPGDNPLLPAFRVSTLPPGGRQTAAPDSNMDQIAEGMGGVSAPSDSGEAPYGSANARGKRRAEQQTPSGGNPPPRRIQRLGSPEASGSSRRGDGPHVARTSHPDPLVEALLSNHPEDAMFPAVDSQDVPWAQSSEVHPLFKRENRHLRPTNISELPQDALANLSFAVAGILEKGDGKKVAVRFNYGGTTISVMKREGMPVSTTGPTMRRLSTLLKSFGRNRWLSPQEIAERDDQFNRGHGLTAIADWFGVGHEAVRQFKKESDERNKGKGSDG